MSVLTKELRDDMLKSVHTRPNFYLTRDNWKALLEDLNESEGERQWLAAQVEALELSAAQVRKDLRAADAEIERLKKAIRLALTEAFFAYTKSESHAHLTSLMNDVLDNLRVNSGVKEAADE